MTYPSMTRFRIKAPMWRVPKSAIFSWIMSSSSWETQIFSCLSRFLSGGSRIRSRLGIIIFHHGALGVVPGTFHHQYPEALLAGVDTSAAERVVSSAALVVEVQRPLILHLFRHSRHTRYSFLTVCFWGVSGRFQGFYGPVNGEKFSEVL